MIPNRMSELTLFPSPYMSPQHFTTYTPRFPFSRRPLFDISRILNGHYFFSPLPFSTGLRTNLPTSQIPYHTHLPLQAPQPHHLNITIQTLSTYPQTRTTRSIDVDDDR